MRPRMKKPKDQRLSQRERDLVSVLAVLVHRLAPDGHPVEVTWQEFDAIRHRPLVREVHADGTRVRLRLVSPEEAVQLARDQPATRTWR